MLCSTICAVCMCYALLYVRCVCAMLYYMCGVYVLCSTICAVCMCYALLYVRCVCAMLYYMCGVYVLCSNIAFMQCSLFSRTTFTIIANILVFACFWILLEKINNSTDTTTHLTPADKEVFWVSSEIVTSIDYGKVVERTLQKLKG